MHPQIQISLLVVLLLLIPNLVYGNPLPPDEFIYHYNETINSVWTNPKYDLSELEKLAAEAKKEGYQNEKGVPLHLSIEGVRILHCHIRGKHEEMCKSFKYWFPDALKYVNEDTEHRIMTLMVMYFFPVACLNVGEAENTAGASVYKLPIFSETLAGYASRTGDDSPIKYLKDKLNSNWSDSFLKSNRLTVQYYNSLLSGDFNDDLRHCLAEAIVKLNHFGYVPPQIYQYAQSLITK